MAGAGKVTCGLVSLPSYLRLRWEYFSFGYGLLSLSDLAFVVSFAGYQSCFVPLRSGKGFGRF